jgi:hypothetical protein
MSTQYQAIPTHANPGGKTTPWGKSCLLIFHPISQGNKIMIDQKIINKLQKLLALSASDNENESALAMKKAEELMREHNLSVADVALDGSGAHVDSAEVCGLTRTCQTWESSLGNFIAKTFNGRAIRTRNSDGWSFVFVAGQTDLIIITDLFERLRTTIKRMSQAYVNSAKAFTRIHDKSLHNSYRLGMINTIVQRLERLKQNTAPTDDRNAFGMTGTALMVIKDKAVDQRVSRLFPRLKTTTSRASRVDGNAYQQGMTDGNNVSLHQAVNGKSSAPLGLKM